MDIKIRQNNKSKKEHMTMDEKLNAVRAGVLGSNDGILTVVGVLFSVAAATTNSFAIFIAGLADLLACALSMASGEYASVSSQSDSEKVVVEQERELLKTDFASEHKTVENFYVDRGVTRHTAVLIADELLSKSPLETMLSVKYDITLGHYLNPWSAAWASLFSAALGGIFPLAALILSPVRYQFIATIGATVVAVALTGFLSASMSNGLVKRAMLRNVIIGLVTIMIHYGVGKIF
ncbi:VIT family protein [Leuconostoc carnosum]|uniref:Integral membrane protein n=1 Tax=Leuconostoc carnosum (strain JB16) TaxID=1229758 RepID=K0DBJ6_LEUCJ|nr:MULTISPECIES: VIT family protein [Leuconostoc]AFT81276.1 integral membrane protein [Leuconostoc carnosum JB16]KAA8326608.1 VIT family protein [Leuconostoc carnosum]KAA8330095.1 VIT family protein [Leuconostoc carnosum]KAA8362169.1 VIT family protein [Leuconostoc carnosum]KAA8366718.1 VIT family protein [Leuconostoc carnosum]